MSRKPSRTGLVVATIAAFFLGALAVFVSLSKPLDGLGWKIHDLVSALGSRPPAPGDFVVVSPAEGNDKPRSAEEALGILRLLDEFRVRAVALESPAFDGGRELEDLAALRSGLPPLVDKETGNLERNIRSLFDALRAGTIPPGELGKYVDSLVAIADRGGERIKEAVGPEGNPVLAALERQKTSLGIDGTAFHDMEPDPDGVLRWLPVIRQEEGQTLPRADLSALIASLGNPSLELTPGRLLLRNAKLPGGREKTLAIPVDKAGRALVPWPKAGSDGQPRGLSLDSLLAFNAEEDEFVSALQAMDSGGLLGGDGSALLSRYRHAALLAETAASGTKSDREEWRDAREEFFAAALAYFREGHEAGLVAAVEVLKNMPGRTDEELGRLDAHIGEIQRSYAEAKRVIEDLTVKRTSLKQGLGGSFVFLSLTVTRPRGSSPLRDTQGRVTDPAFAGAAFASSVLSQGLPRVMPRSVVLAMALLLTLAVSLIPLMAAARGRLQKVSGLLLLAGFAAVFMGSALSLAGFLFFKLFLTPLPLVLGPLCAVLLASAFLRPFSLGKQGQRQEVCVATFKAVGLVRGADGLEPARACDLLASFEDKVGAIVASTGGLIVLADGPSMVAVFTDKPGLSPAAGRALKAAVAASSLHWEGGDISVGLDSGDCLIVRSPSLPWRRQVLGLVGPAADLAQRLADLCGHFGTHVLATEAALEHSGSGIDRRSLGELRVEATGRKAELYALDPGR